MWEIINFFLLLVIILVIILIFVLALVYYYKIKAYVDDAIDHIGSLIPIFNPYDYSDIMYPEISLEDLKTENFNIKIGLLLCNVNMSTYNIFSKFDPRLPDNIKLHRTIGDNCYIYKYSLPGVPQIRIFSFRGTRTGDDVITDLDSIQSEMSGYDDKILVHRGFYRMWVQYKDEFKSYLKNKITDDTIILVTGHSLGCAGAIFTSLLIKSYINKDSSLYMFAPPRIGNHHLIQKLDQEISNNYAIINVPDFVPTLPPMALPTRGDTWVYENFSNRYLIDYQMGSVTLNHRLDTYICGLNEKLEFCKEPIWKKVPTLITTV